MVADDLETQFRLAKTRWTASHETQLFLKRDEASASGCDDDRIPLNPHIGEWGSPGP